jgi:DNA-binding IclR family transcriptional regulator
MLAQMPPAQVRALYSDPSFFVLRNDLGPRSLTALRHLLTDTRRQGFASEDGEVTPEFASVAVAVSDRAGYPVAAVAVTFPGAEVDPAELERLAGRVARTAAELSRRLGSSPQQSETSVGRAGT